MIVMKTTVHALRNCMTPSSWAKYARANGIAVASTGGPDTVVTDTDDLKKYEVTPELLEAMANAERLEAEFKALGITLDI